MRVLGTRSALVSALLLACGKTDGVTKEGPGEARRDGEPPEQGADGGAALDGAVGDGPAVGCPDFAPPGPVAAVLGAVLVEASGLVASHKNAGVLWSHNDSGDQARIVALRRDGSLMGVVELAGARAVDWEDIALAPGAGGNDELVIGDIGDNAEKRTSVFAYRIAEPDLGASVPTEIPSEARRARVWRRQGAQRGGDAG